MKISLYIVEDYPLSRVGLRHSLLKYNEIEILGEFETAEECIQALDDKQSNIVLMDLGLPSMGGIEATKIIKSKCPDVKIIALTSHEKEESVLSALSAGANAYCLKDTSDELLFDIIKMVNQGALWLAPKIASIPCNHIAKIQNNIKKKQQKNNIDKKLTARELSVLGLVVEGKSNTEIAKEMSVSKHTAKAHVASILSKLNVEDRVQAAVKAIQTNIV